MSTSLLYGFVCLTLCLPGVAGCVIEAADNPATQEEAAFALDEFNGQEDAPGSLGSPESRGRSVSDAPDPRASLSWVFDTNGHLPANAIVGGWEPGRTLFICRSWYGGGVHPGKIVGSNCNIGWGGSEIVLNACEVLVGDNSRITWVDASYGGVPAGAFSGGSEPGRSNLYVCRVDYRGLQPGKLVGENCNIGYGGQELVFPNYQVLVPR